MKGKRKQRRKRIKNLHDVLEKKNYVTVKAEAEGRINWKFAEY